MTNESVFGNQAELATMIQNNSMAGVAIQAGDLQITYGTLLMLCALAVSAQTLADVMPEPVKALVGTTNDEVVKELSKKLDAFKENLSIKVSPKAGAVNRW